MKNSIKRGIMLSALFGILLLNWPASADEGYQVRLAGGPSGGHFLVFGTSLFKIIKKALPEFDVGPPQVTGGSVENTRLLGTGKVHFAYTAEAAEAYKGIDKWKNERYENLRSIHTYAHGYYQVITLAGSNIRSFKDLKGKRISIGPAGSGCANQTKNILLPAHGINPGDYTESQHPYASACRGIRDGSIDATFMSVLAPQSSVMELSAFKKIYLVPMDPKVAEKIAGKYSKLAVDYIPPDVYGKNQKNEKPIASLSIMVGLCTRADVPEDVVYKFTKAYWENIDVLHNADELGKKAISIDNPLMALPTPLHPGAEKYYRERGIWPPKK
jgi:TRAP transporter TAXI family solute receptor